jgi:hypothetical protein
VLTGLAAKADAHARKPICPVKLFANANVGNMSNIVIV